MRRALRPGGVLAMNVIAAVEGEDGRLLRAIHAGLQRHFARVEVFCVTDPGHPGQLQNLMVLAFSDAATAAALRDGPAIRRRWRPCWPAVIVLPCRLRSPCVTTSPRWNVSPCRCCGVPEPEGSSFSCDFLDVVQARCGRSCPSSLSAARGRHGHPFGGKRQGAGSHTARSRESRMRHARPGGQACRLAPKCVDCAP